MRISPDATCAYRGPSAELLRVLAERGGQESFGMLPPEVRDAVCELEAGGLASREPLEGRPVNRRLCIVFTVELGTADGGPLRRMESDRTVPPGWSERLYGATVPRLVDDLVGVARRSSSWPKVSTQCTVSAMSLAAMLRTRRHPALVVVGGQTDAFEPHAWVEVRGRRVDPSGLTAYLEPFVPMDV